MIVRIMEEGQFRLEDAAQMQAFEQLDDALHAAVEAQDSMEFAAVLGRLITFIKTSGRPVPIIELVPSDVVVPAENMTLAEAAVLLSPAEVPDAPQA